MSKFIKVEVHDHEPTNTHFVIYDDGVVRSRLKVTEHTGKIRVILVSVNGHDLNDAQCQAAAVTVAACQLKYGITETPFCSGVKWEEIIRRG